jgi:hypothetical protein
MSLADDSGDYECTFKVFSIFGFFSHGVVFNYHLEVF